MRAFDYRRKKQKENRPIVPMGGTQPQQNQGNSPMPRDQDLTQKYQSGEGRKRERNTYLKEIRA